MIGARQYAVGLSVISLSFVVSPVLINLGYKLTEALKQARPANVPQEPLETAEGSVIVADYGYVGRTICTMLERAKIRYTALELDPDLLAMGQKWKHNVQYGDAADPALVRAIANTRPRLVIATNGTSDTSRRMIDHLRQFYPRASVIVAVPYLFQRDALRKAGVDDVVALSPEGVLSFGRRILDRLDIAPVKSDTIVQALQANDYLALRMSGGGDAEEPRAATASPASGKDAPSPHQAR